MNRLKERWVLFFGIDIAGRRQPHRSHDRSAEIRQNIAEEVGGNHNVEPIRMGHEMRAQDVNQELVGLHIRILLGDHHKSLVPKRHGEDDAVRLSGRRNVLLSAAREFKSIFHNAIATATREDIFLDCHLEIAVLVQAATNLRVFAFIVLANDDEVDLARPPIAERSCHAVKKSEGANVYVLLEPATYRNQQAPKRNVIRLVEETHGTEKNGVKGTQLLEPVLRHHPSSCQKRFTT